MNWARIVAVAVMAACVGLGSTARANVVYDLLAGTTTTTGGTPASETLSFQLTLFNDFAPGPISRQCDMGCYAHAGSFDDFVLTAFAGTTVLGVLNNMPDQAFEHTSGLLQRGSGTLNWNTSDLNIDLTFGKGVWNASFNSDAAPYQRECAGGMCTASGTLVKVPEPASVAVFAFGLIALLGLRRRSVGEAF